MHNDSPIPRDDARVFGILKKSKMADLRPFLENFVFAHIFLNIRPIHVKFCIEIASDDLHTQVYENCPKSPEIGGHLGF